MGSLYLTDIAVYSYIHIYEKYNISSKNPQLAPGTALHMFPDFMR